MVKTTLILHDIRSVYNVGAIFRTADAIGISKIYLSGYTPSPIDRFGRKRKDLHKSALGAEDFVEWQTAKDPIELLGELKKDGYLIVALEQSKRSRDYKKIKLAKKTAVVIGSEVGGMDKALLKKCDVIAEIPMRGKKDSLNVSVATGILLYRLFDK